jgi:hypothetical protein
MRHFSAVLVCVIVFICVSGCSQKHESATSTGASAEPNVSSTENTADVGEATPAPSQTPPFGELIFNPGLELTFTPTCSVAPPGVGPTAGYTLSIGVTDDISYGRLRVPEYAGAAGTFAETASLLASDPSFAVVLKTHSLVAVRSSSIVTTLTDHGLKGSAQLTNFQVDGTIVNAGTITWECTELSR